MQTTLEPFARLNGGESFIFDGIVFRKTNPSRALNCHTLLTQAFDPYQLVEVVKAAQHSQAPITHTHNLHTNQEQP